MMPCAIGVAWATIRFARVVSGVPQQGRIERRHAVSLATGMRSAASSLREDPMGPALLEQDDRGEGSRDPGVITFVVCGVCGDALRTRRHHRRRSSREHT